MSDIETDAGGASSTGLEPQFAAALAYLAGPFSGLVILLAERTNRYVRFHAWQAVAGLGALGLLVVVLWLAAFLGLFVSPSLFRTLLALAVITAVLWVVLWAVCLFKAFGGAAWKLPLAGSFAQRRASRNAT